MKQESESRFDANFAAQMLLEIAHEQSLEKLPQTDSLLAGGAAVQPEADAIVVHNDDKFLRLPDSTIKLRCRRVRIGEIESAGCGRIGGYGNPVWCIQISASLNHIRHAGLSLNLKDKLMGGWQDRLWKDARRGRLEHEHVSRIGREGVTKACADAGDISLGNIEGANSGIGGLVLGIAV